MQPLAQRVQSKVPDRTDIPVMATASRFKVLLLSVLAALLLWRGAATAHESSPFEVSARIRASEVIVTLTLPALCVRLSTRLVDDLMAVSRLGLCNRCTTRPLRRSWS